MPLSEPLYPDIKRTRAWAGTQNIYGAIASVSIDLARAGVGPEDREAFRRDITSAGSHEEAIDAIGRWITLN